jgi:hypothetical protein
LFGHLNIENMLNFSRFESVVAAALHLHASWQQQQQQQQQDQHSKRKTSAKSRKRGGDVQGLVQLPACDSPSTDEAEVALAAIQRASRETCGK